MPIEKINPVRAVEAQILSDASEAVFVFRRTTFELKQDGAKPSLEVSASIALPWPVVVAFHEALSNVIKARLMTETKGGAMTESVAALDTALAKPN